MVGRAFLFAIMLTQAAMCAEFSIIGNIHYSKLPETVLDLVQPPRPALKDRPAVLLIHGGGWVGGSKADMVGFLQPLIEKDFVVANVEYRLADSAPAPAAVTDVLNAAKWLTDHAGEYRIDAKHIIAMGVSAGAHLALLAAMLPDNNPFGPVTRFAGVVDLYGPTNLVEYLDGPGKRDFAEKWLPEQSGRMALARQISPLSYVRKDLPPLLVVHGDSDQLVPITQSAELVTALKNAGAKVEFITVQGGGHGFTADQDKQFWLNLYRWLKHIKIG